MKKFKKYVTTKFQRIKRVVRDRLTMLFYNRTDNEFTLIANFNDYQK